MTKEMDMNSVNDYGLPVEHREHPDAWTRVKIYKTDKRTKSGKRLMDSIVMDATKAFKLKISGRDGLIYELNPAYRLVTNIMTGQKVWEDADMSHNLSVSSETYWSS